MEYPVASGQSEFVLRLFMSPPTVCQILHGVKPTLQNPLSFSSFLVCGTLFWNNSKHFSSLFLQALLSSSPALYFFVCQTLWSALREGTPACIFFLCLLTLLYYALASTAIIINTLLVVFFKELCVREHPNTNLHVHPQALFGRPPSNWYWHFFW